MSWLNQETAAEWRREGKRYAAVTPDAPIQYARQGVGSSGVTTSHCVGNTNILQMRIKAKSVKLNLKKNVYGI
ncbi:hypothetical protein [Paenibacillus maysiensis]|uniref:hypothetical protein n=1 Tax=Paenibacillus maysiensis TaxID=1155954 RepID=UPI00046FB400|nr:hypothetical protein [Paenibacillus maysiensis]